MTPLERLIRRRVEECGPLSIADFMTLAMNHPELGYYRSGDPLGRHGDFTTAPEISQVFGELIGLWAGVTWRRMGAPNPVLLAECGPGRGTMMQDILRASSGIRGFRDAVRLHLVEVSPAMRALQKRRLNDAAPHWHDSTETVPPGPMILVANEFLDALPIQQLVRVTDGWAERRIAVVGDELAFVHAAQPDSSRFVPAGIGAAPVGAVFEFSPERARIATWIGDRLRVANGAALLIDYGHDRSAPGETLQAVRNHAPVPALSAIGEADLSAHVDFQAIGRQLERGGTAVYGPVTQRRFLLRLGIEVRTDRLAMSAGSRAGEVRAASGRLIDPRQMGTLFKVLVATSPGLPAAVGFEEC